MKSADFNRIRHRLPGVTRRDFMKFCSAMAAAMALPVEISPKIAHALTSPGRPPVIWLHGSECTGCSMSLLRTDHPSIENLIFDLISLDYHETLESGAGKQAEESLHRAIEENYGKFVLVIEGAIPTKDGGIYCRIAGRNFVDIVKEVGEKAGSIIAIGSCAVWGGVAAAKPNPTGCVGVRDVLPDKQVIAIPGCPSNPYNLLSTITYYLTFNKLPALDRQNRPKFIFSRLLHDHCERRPHFDAGRFARQFGDEGHRKGYCLYYLGCKGPITHANCSTLQFGDAGSGCWPVAIGHPCFGCAEEGVGFAMPQFTTSPVMNVTPAATHAPINVERGQGVSPGSAALLAGVAGAAIGAGAVFTAKIGDGKQKEKQGHEDQKA